MNFSKDPRTNWKYILIVVILAAIIGGGILSYLQVTKEELEIPPIEIEIPVVGEEAEKDLYYFLKNKVVAYPWDTIRRRQIYEERFIFDDESLKEAILRHIVEELDLFYHLTKEEIDLVESVEMSILEIDLNEDNVLEYIIVTSGIEMLKEESPRYLNHCGTGGCPIYIFGFVEEDWKLIGELWGFWRGSLEDRRIEGYPNLVIFLQMGAGRGEYQEYAWTGERYELIKTTEFNGITPIPDEYWKFERG